MSRPRNTKALDNFCFRVEVESGVPRPRNFGMGLPIAKDRVDKDEEMNSDYSIISQVLQ